MGYDTKPLQVNNHSTHEFDFHVWMNRLINDQQLTFDLGAVGSESIALHKLNTALMRLVDEQHWCLEEAERHSTISDRQIKFFRRTAEESQNQNQKLHQDMRNNQEQKQGEVNELRAQVMRLEQSISSSAATADFETDDAIIHQTKGLFHDMQTWAVTAIRSCKPGRTATGFAPIEWLRQYMPFHSWPNTYQGDVKKYLMGTLITSLIAPVNKMHKENLALSLCDFSAPKLLLATCLSQECPEGTSFSQWKKWLNSARNMIMAKNRTFLQTCGEAAVQTCIKFVVVHYEETSRNKLSTGMIKSLDRLYRRAFQLLVTIHFHPAVNHLIMFPACVWETKTLLSFDPRRHEDMEQEETAADTSVYLSSCVFPALIKTRNEQGDEIQEVVISKAKVHTHQMTATSPTYSDESEL
ncbi:hypothetical protein B9Z65_8144 [Elsinoe australis]|uniref:Uncharacterized protein n=1 Tax=Elsinoe australis TaxID=40998 RepID=A0A2P7YW76_9PEZI|nr:hypothetical protein B9Z65_8144 [Elsinoe australis]